MTRDASDTDVQLDKPSSIRPAVTRRAEMASAGRKPRLLVVDDDPDVERIIERWAAQHFVDLVCAKTRSEARARLSAGPVDAAIISSELGGEPSHDLGPELRSLTGDDLPIAFLSRDDRAPARALAALSGGTIFITKPLTESRLEDAVTQLLSLRDEGRRRVVIIDPDPAFRNEARRALEAAGIDVRAESGAGDVIRLLESSDPDALVVELSARALGALDVCRVVRTSPGWQDLPILVVSSCASDVLRIRAFRAGCDDYLDKPLTAEELVTRVGARVDRRRMLQARLAQDPLTGLPLRRAFIDRARARLSEARRHHHLISLCLIDLDRFKGINDRFGHLAGDRVLSSVGGLLSSRLRAEDLRARWGGEEFVLAFPRQDRVSATRAVQKLLAELRETPFVADDGRVFHASFSAGIATWPNDGDSLEQLLKTADARLYAAKAAGRARIVAA